MLGKGACESADVPLDVVAFAPAWRTTTDPVSKEISLMAMKKATRKKAGKKKGARKKAGKKKGARKGARKGRRKASRK